MDLAYGIIVRVNNMFVAWCKVVRRLWKLPNMTHRNLLTTINSSLPIEIALEKRCVKCIHSCLNSNNLIINSTSISALTTHRSQFRDNSMFVKNIRFQEVHSFY